MQKLLRDGSMMSCLSIWPLWCSNRALVAGWAVGGGSGGGGMVDIESQERGGGTEDGAAAMIWLLLLVFFVSWLEEVSLCSPSVLVFCALVLFLSSSLRGRGVNWLWYQELKSSEPGDPGGGGFWDFFFAGDLKKPPIFLNAFMYD